VAAALRAALLATGEDGTVIAARPAILAQPALVAAFAEETLNQLARRLTPYVGPIAPRLVASAARGAGNLEDLCDSLPRNIGEETERLRFRREVLLEADLGSRTGSGSLAARSSASQVIPATWLAEESAAATAALIPHLGPITRILVQREAGAAADAEDLWSRLAQRITDPAERAAFLRKRSPR
jgi:hypothetical protein